MMRPLICSLFAVCLLFAGLARGCEWDQSVEENQGLDLTSEEPELPHTDLVSEAKTPESCQAACCNKPDCDLALVGFPMDGGPQCMLVRCWINDRDVCVITPNAQFKIYRKQVERETRGKATDGGERLRAVPLVEAEEARSNDSNNIYCRLPMKVGPCRASFPRFYYDVTNRSCRGFIYGGCGANQNNFESQEDCEGTCSGVTGSVLPDESTPAPPQVPAKSARMAPAVHTNVMKDSETPAESQPAAESTDIQKKDMSAEDFDDHCMVKADPGPCRAAFSKFYYNPNTGNCHRFTYGGCRGNKNRYDSVEECMSHCSMDSPILRHPRTQNRWTVGLFLFITLAVISALLLVALIIVIRRRSVFHRPSSISDKQELLPDEQSSVESLSIPDSPKLDKA